MVNNEKKKLVLIQAAEEFAPEAYTDEYRQRVLAMIEKKPKGETITVAPTRPAAGPVIDLWKL